MIYQYRKFDLPISETRFTNIGIRFTDIGKSADKWITDIWKSISDIGKSDDFPISVNQNDLPISEIRFTDIGNSIYQYRNSIYRYW